MFQDVKENTETSRYLKSKVLTNLSQTAVKLIFDLLNVTNDSLTVNLNWFLYILFSCGHFHNTINCDGFKQVSYTNTRFIRDF